jgi:hypothetical protein
MSRWQHTYRGAAIALVTAIVMIALPAVMHAQPDNTQAPKAELFVGYEWLNPGGNIPDNNVPPNAFHLPAIAQGGGASVSWNFNNYFSFEGAWGLSGNKYATINTTGFGPKLTYRGPDGINFFAHTLVGWQRLTSRSFGSDTGVSMTLGGGMDIRIWKPLTFRLFGADYVWAHHDFAEVAPLTDPGVRRSDFDGARLSTGLVFNFGGGAPEAAVAAACSVQNPDVMVGEPVHATVAASNFNPKHTLTYTWAASGGKIEGKDTAATIDTNGIAGGAYTVTATVTDAKAKKNNTASCTANFTVKEPPKNPPQISCSADPSQVQAGTSSTISCTCTSPDNVPVTISGWNASGGSLSGNGNSATLGTAGAASGPITISATCTDSRGLTASSSATVTVENPPPAPPQASKLNQCDYPNAKKPWRVDNTCKAMLDDVAGKLQQDPDAKLVVVGNADPAEAKKSRHKNLAAERAVDVKYYITEGEAQQHIDASRIETRTGDAGTATSEQWIVPAGATFPNASSTTPVDETKIKPILDHPKPMAKKKAKKAE